MSARSRSEPVCLTRAGIRYAGWRRARKTGPKSHAIAKTLEIEPRRQLSNDHKPHPRPRRLASCKPARTWIDDLDDKVAINDLRAEMDRRSRPTPVKHSVRKPLRCDQTGIGNIRLTHPAFSRRALDRFPSDRYRTSRRW
jgi:hypothetical protein